MLTENEIRARLREGSLSLSPFDDADVTPTGINVRLGGEFSEGVPPETRGRRRAARTRVNTIPLGKYIELESASSILATSLEFISMPGDLIGTLVPRVPLVQSGIVGAVGIIHPFFKGKVIFSLFNVSNGSAALYPGMRIGTLALIAVGRSSPPNQASDLKPADEVYEIKPAIDAIGRAVRSAYSPARGIETLLAQALTAPRPEKGRKLEIFATQVVRMIHGLKIVRTNAQLRAEELDILVQNDSDVGFWRFLGSPLVVECKNWSSKVSAREIGVLGDKLRSLGPDAKTAILVAPNGLTGQRSDAWLKVRELRQQGKYIVVMGPERLEEISSGRHPADVIESAFQELWLV